VLGEQFRDMMNPFEIAVLLDGKDDADGRRSILEEMREIGFDLSEMREIMSQSEQLRFLPLVMLKKGNNDEVKEDTMKEGRLALFNELREKKVVLKEGNHDSAESAPNNSANLPFNVALIARRAMLDDSRDENSDENEWTPEHAL
jgi:hypothetical protein